MPRPIRATISAGAFAHNLLVAKAYAGARTKVWAVLKANAYGHGLTRAAQALQAADGYAVLDFVEALKLRSAGIDKPILMLEGFFKPEDLPLIARHRLTPEAFACTRTLSTVRAPIPRAGVFTTRSNDGSSSRFAIKRRYANASLISARSKKRNPP